MRKDRQQIEYRCEQPGAAAYFQLFDSTGWNNLYKVQISELSKALENTWYVVCAYDSEQLVGMGRIVSDGVLYAMIYDMIVLPDYQGRGIGSRMLDKLIERCRQAGIRDLQLFSAAGKMSFYDKRGFQERPGNSAGMRFTKS